MSAFTESQKRLLPWFAVAVVCTGALALLYLAGVHSDNAKAFKVQLDEARRQADEYRQSAERLDRELQLLQEELKRATNTPSGSKGGPPKPRLPPAPNE